MTAESSLGDAKSSLGDAESSLQPPPSTQASIPRGAGHDEISAELGTKLSADLSAGAESSLGRDQNGDKVFMPPSSASHKKKLGGTWEVLPPSRARSIAGTVKRQLVILADKLQGFVGSLLARPMTAADISALTDSHNDLSSIAFPVATVPDTSWTVDGKAPQAGVMMRFGVAVMCEQPHHGSTHIANPRQGGQGVENVGDYYSEADGLVAVTARNMMVILQAIAITGIFSGDLIAAGMQYTPGEGHAEHPHTAELIVCQLDFVMKSGRTLILVGGKGAWAKLVKVLRPRGEVAGVETLQRAKGASYQAIFWI